MYDTCKKHFPKHSSQKITETIESASDGNQLLLISVEPTYPADSRMIQDGKEIPYVREGSMCNPKTNTWFQDYDRKRKKPLGKKIVNVCTSLNENFILVIFQYRLLGFY